MTSVSKLLAIAATVLFIGGIFFTSYTLLNLPEALQEASLSIDLLTLQELSPVLTQVYLATGITLTLGLFALMLSLNKKQAAPTVTVVQKAAQTNQEQDDENKDEREEARLTLSSKLQESLKEIDAMEAGEAHQLEACLRAVCNELEASQGAVYVSVIAEQRFLDMQASYAYIKPDSARIRYEYGEGLPGQTAKEGQLRNLNNVPEGQLQITSGLGKATPTQLLLVPIFHEEQVVGVVEIASFTAFKKAHEQLVTTTFSQYSEAFSSLSARLLSQHPQDQDQNQFA